MADYPYLVLVPSSHVDETTMGEWLEQREVDYVNPLERITSRTAYAFRFASQTIAEEFAHTFVA